MNKANWSIEEEIRKRVELESWYDWAQKPTDVIQYDYRPQKLVLTEAAKEAFAKGIHLVKLLRL
jgi:hypothetical protein